MWGKRDDMVVHDVEPFNAEPPPYALADQPLTGVDTFYSRNHGPIPQLHAPDWRLAVDGLVTNELDLTLDDLQNGFEHISLPATLQCAGNRRTGLLQLRDIPGEAPWRSGAVSTARWTGVRLGDVLRAAGVAEDAQHTAFEAPDVSADSQPAQAYGSSIPLSKALGGEVLLAWEMNCAPLSDVHGAPVRVVVPGYIGARSVKWVQRVAVQCEPSQNYFQTVAYRLLPPEADPDTAGPAEGLQLGAVALNADVLRPADGDTVPAGPTEISGYAFAGDQRRIARVDVSLDGGASWVQADLDEPASDWTWQLWRAVLDLAEGPHQVTVRAWDTTGASQPKSPAALWNPKGYVNNSWARIGLTATSTSRD
ncbi:MAG: sulfite oxidase [Nocardioidaceae bacterium]